MPSSDLALKHLGTCDLIMMNIEQACLISGMVDCSRISPEFQSMGIFAQLIAGCDGRLVQV